MLGSCVILQRLAAMLWVLRCQAAVVEQQPFAYPPGAGWELGDQLHWGSLPSPARPPMPFGSFSKAMTPCNAFGAVVCPFFPLGFSSFNRLHLPGVNVDVSAVGCLFLAV